MIDYSEQELDRPLVPGIPDDIAFLGAGLKQMTHWMRKTYDALRRQETPNPTVINLNPGVTQQTTAQMRSYALVFSGGTAGEVFGLRIGAAIAWDWIVPTSPGIVTFPMPLVFQAGVDVTVVDQTTPSATNWRCRVLAYAEMEDGEA